MTCYDSDYDPAENDGLPEEDRRDFDPPVHVEAETEPLTTVGIGTVRQSFPRKGTPGNYGPDSPPCPDIVIDIEAEVVDERPVDQAIVRVTVANVIPQQLLEWARMSGIQGATAWQVYGLIEGYGIEPGVTIEMAKVTKEVVSRFVTDALRWAGEESAYITVSGGQHAGDEAILFYADGRIEILVSPWD